MVGEAWFMDDDNFAATVIGNVTIIFTDKKHKKSLVPVEKKILCTRLHWHRFKSIWFEFFMKKPYVFDVPS